MLAGLEFQGGMMRFVPKILKSFPKEHRVWDAPIQKILHFEKTMNSCVGLANFVIFSHNQLTHFAFYHKNCPNSFFPATNSQISRFFFPEINRQVSCYFCDQLANSRVILYIFSNWKNRSSLWKFKHKSIMGKYCQFWQSQEKSILS